MLQVNDKVKFKKGPFTDILGGDAAFTVTAVFQKGDAIGNGEVYNGPEPIYRIATDDPSVPAPLRVLLEREDSIRSV